MKSNSDKNKNYWAEGWYSFQIYFKNATLCDLKKNHKWTKIDTILSNSLSYLT